MKPRLLMADDHTLVLEGIRKLLENDFELVGAVEDGRALLQAAEQLRPDVILRGYFHAPSERDRSLPPISKVDA